MIDPVDPVSPPVALTIAGSDSGGGAGIQADLKTMTVHGVFGTSVVTATTAQNTRGVRDVAPLSADHVAAQYDAVVEDLAPSAVKTGMLATREVVEATTRKLGSFDGPVVVDPVMVAATGDRLLSPDAEAAYEELVATATLVTPNADEAAILVDDAVDTPADAAAAGRRLVELGADAALVKGGHLAADGDADADDVATDGNMDADADGDAGRDDVVVDTLVLGGGAEDGTNPRVRRIENPRVAAAATHGSGCVLSSAIAARLAHGEPLAEAVVAAVDGMGEAIRRGYDVGAGPGAVNPTRLDPGR